MAGSEARLFTIPLWRPFAHDLAAGLLDRFPDPLDLARVLVILPSRRAVRTLTDAFVALSDGKALLLPRMEPAGDMDIDEAPGGFLGRQDTLDDLLPEAPPLARRLILARILGGARPMTATEALMLADQMASALDTLDIEGRSLAEIDDIIPAESANHWERNRRILHRLHSDWPAILEARGWMSGAERRNRLLKQLAQRWSRTPPEHPVIMAGFASAPPAVAGLAAVVARLTKGMLIVPGLDTGLDDTSRKQIAQGLESHPQFALLRLLQLARLSPAEAVDWPFQARTAGSSPLRADLARALSLPSGNAGAVVAPTPADMIDAIHMVETAGVAEEALVIAIAMRQVIDHEGRRAALVTPDRALARRVQVQLRRFGIDIDDSAGVPLDKSGPGSLLVQLAEAAAERFAPIPLLGMLLHPLVQAGPERLVWLNRVRALDRLALRGLRPPAGLDGVTRRLSTAPAELRQWWTDEVVPILRPVETLPTDASTLIVCLREAASQLAGQTLWAGEAGHSLSALLERLAGHGEDLARLAVDQAEAAGFIAALLKAETVRPRWGRHPQLAVFGPLEARLQHADLVILGGMNEGSWPGTMAADAFLPPAVRRALDLPGVERRTGLQAHDFASALGAPELLITRPARLDGAPQVASRFWQRMVAVCGTPPDGDGPMVHGRALLAAARSLLQPSATIRLGQPAPAPPASARPRKLRVTEVAMLKADPFSFYARHMLKLLPLEQRDAEPTAGERGQVVHAILEDWFNDPSHDIEKLIDSRLAKLGDRPELSALWKPRVARMVQFAIDQFDHNHWQFVKAETDGAWTIGGVLLKGRADRVDRSRDGGLRIVDYKTGTLPTVKDIESCWETQLGLLGAMAGQGLLKGVAGGQIESLQYLKLAGGSSPGVTREALGQNSTPEGVQKHISEAVADLELLIAAYLLGDRPFLAKLHMVQGRRWRDYDLLARVAEWLGR